MQNTNKNTIANRPNYLRGKSHHLEISQTVFAFDEEIQLVLPLTPIIPSLPKKIMRMNSSGARSLIGSPNVQRSSIEIKSGITKKLSAKSTNSVLFSNSSHQFTTHCKKQLNQLALEKVFGFTIQNNAAVALDPTSGIVAFPAGCVVVGYSAKRSKQFFIHNSVKSPITAIAFSRDGKLLATGESGKAPKVRIWSVETHTQLFEFSGHNYRVGALAFSHNSRFVVSVGSQEDTTINVWELSSNTKMASSKVTSKVIAIAFSEAGQFFVTVGVRHVRFWYLDSSRTKSKSTIPLLGRSAILGDFMNNTFTDVGCCCLNSGSGSGQMTSSMCSSFTSSTNQSYTYVISQAGQLMQFTEQRYLDKWVELRTPKATCLTVYESCIMVGCSRGIILIFDTTSLSHIATLPMPHYLGINLQNPTDNDTNIGTDPVRYPDVVAGKYDYVHSRITCFYSDHSIYVWDVRDFRNPSKVVSHLYHSGGVWSAESVTITKKDEKNILDVTSFITCSDDETIRFWHLVDSNLNAFHSKSESLPTQWENDYSRDLIKIIYTDSSLKSLIEADRNFARNKQQNNEATVHIKHGVRSIKISPDRQHLAAADREGNIKFYSLLNCKEIYSIIAHNGEILSIDYFQSPSAPDLVLFCSASRDRVIHVMDPSQGYKCIQTIDDHSGAIFAAKLVETPNDQEIRLISCGMDKSLLFRILQPDESGQTAQFFLNQHLVGKQSQYDMVIAPNNRYAAVVCQDRQVRIYNMVSGKQRKSYRGASSDDGYLLKCAVDPSGTYIATSGSDKYISILNFATGELLASVTGHSEIAVGLCFLDDLKHLISVSSDSCIFVWKLPVEMTLNMHRRMQELRYSNSINLTESDLKKDTAPPSTTGTVTPPRISDEISMETSNTSLLNALSNNIISGENITADNGPAFRFSVSALPSWAQKKFSRRDSVTFVQVNMMNEFCGSNICSVPESNIEHISEENPVKYQPPPFNELSRRVSYIATEKVIRDDDSDNLEGEDESEWFNPIDKNECVPPHDIESLIQRISTGEEDEDDEDENVKTIKSFPVRSMSLENEETHKSHCEYIIKKNNATSDTNEEENIMSTSAPSALATWINNKVEGSSSDEPVSGHLTDSDEPPNSTVFTFDNCFNMDTGSGNSNGFRSSLTTKYLSKNTYEPSILQYPYKSDQDCSEKLNLKSIDIPSPAQKSIHLAPSNTKSNLAKKALSEVNVNQTNVIIKKPDSATRKTSFHIQSCKSSQSFGQHTKNRSESREIKPELIKTRKPSGSNVSSRSNISKATSTSSVSTIGRPSDTRLRNSVDSQNSRSSDNKILQTKPATKPTNRARWGEPKRTRDMRKTCPVDLKDIKLANCKGSARFENKQNTANVEHSQVTIPSNIDNFSSVKKEQNNEKINEIKNQNIEKSIERVKSSSPLTKGASFDLSSARSKEHVIDEIEEISSISSRGDFNVEVIPSALEDMFRFLSDQSHTNIENPESSTIIRSTASGGSGGECVMEKPVTSLDSPSQSVFDDWIDDVCRTHNVEFLTNIVLKILHKFLDNTEWKTESQVEAARRLFPEIERMYRHLRIICEPSSLTEESEIPAAIIRDIGERIFEEVKRRLSDSL